MDTSRARVLVVDDDDALLALLGDELRVAGYEVRLARSGFEAVRVAADQQLQLILVDVDLPDLDGFEVCRRLRRGGSDVPLIFLTARGDRADGRSGFTRGVTDSVTKPFSLEELHFRIRAVLHRAESRTTERALTCGDLRMDVAAHRVTCGEEEVALSPTEFRLLRYLLMHQGQVLSKTQILHHVWRYDFDGDASIVETYVSYLRKKVDRRNTRLIRTARGFGYSIRAV